MAGKRCFERRYLRGDITSRPVSRSLYYVAYRRDGERMETKVFQSVRGEAVDKDRNSVLLVDGSV